MTSPLCHLKKPCNWSCRIILTDNDVRVRGLVPNYLSPTAYSTHRPSPNLLLFAFTALRRKRMVLRNNTTDYLIIHYLSVIFNGIMYHNPVNAADSSSGNLTFIF